MVRQRGEQFHGNKCQVRGGVSVAAAAAAAAAVAVCAAVPAAAAAVPAADLSPFGPLDPPAEIWHKEAR